MAVVYFIAFVWICSNMAKENKRKVEEWLDEYPYKDFHKK